MQTNTLVFHKRNKTLGIGCISTVLTKSVKVNFGTHDVKTCNQSMLEIIDTTKCKTVTFNEYKTRVLKDNGANDVIVGNELQKFVGIGWVTTRVVTLNDLKKYPRVI